MLKYSKKKISFKFSEKVVTPETENISGKINMKKNQLFRKTPCDEVIHQIVAAFGFRSLNDRRSFSRGDLIKLDTVSKIKEMKSKLEQYYLPCKARTYLNDLNEKNVVTILRQCIKTRGHTICSREKYLKGDKFIIYSLCPLDQKEYVSVVSGNVDMKAKSTILIFD